MSELPGRTPAGEFIQTPHPHDVLCGRGGLTNQHPGNEWFRRLVRSNRALYRSCPKHTKLLVAKAIVQAVEQQEPPGRFLEGDKVSKGAWRTITYKRSVDKTSQALREKDPAVKDAGAGKGPKKQGAAQGKASKTKIQLQQDVGKKPATFDANTSEEPAQGATITVRVPPPADTKQIPPPNTKTKAARKRKAKEAAAAFVKPAWWSRGAPPSAATMGWNADTYANQQGNAMQINGGMAAGINANMQINGTPMDMANAMGMAMQMNGGASMQKRIKMNNDVGINGNGANANCFQNNNNNNNNNQQQQAFNANNSNSANNSIASTNASVSGNMNGGTTATKQGDEEELVPLPPKALEARQSSLFRFLNGSSFFGSSSTKKSNANVSSNNGNAGGAVQPAPLSSSSSLFGFPPFAAFAGFGGNPGNQTNNAGNKKSAASNKPANMNTAVNGIANPAAAHAFMNSMSNNMAMMQQQMNPMQMANLSAAQQQEVQNAYEMLRKSQQAFNNALQRTSAIAPISVNNSMAAAAAVVREMERKQELEQQPQQPAQNQNTNPQSFAEVQKFMDNQRLSTTANTMAAAAAAVQAFDAQRRASQLAMNQRQGAARAGGIDPMPLPLTDAGSNAAANPRQAQIGNMMKSLMQGMQDGQPGEAGNDGQQDQAQQPQQDTANASNGPANGAQGGSDPPPMNRLTSQMSDWLVSFWPLGKDPNGNPQQQQQQNQGRSQPQQPALQTPQPARQQQQQQQQASQSNGANEDEDITSGPIALPTSLEPGISTTLLKLASSPSQIINNFRTGMTSYFRGGEQGEEEQSGQQGEQQSQQQPTMQQAQQMQQKQQAKQHQQAALQKQAPKPAPQQKPQEKPVKKLQMVPPPFAGFPMNQNAAQANVNVMNKAVSMPAAPLPGGVPPPPTSILGTSSSSGQRRSSLLDDYDESPLETQLRNVRSV